MGAALWELRQKLQTTAQGVTGGGYTLANARVVLGYDDLAETTEFLQSLKDDGPYLSIRGGALREWDFVKQQGQYEISCDLWIGITRETDDDLVNCEKLLDALKVAWTARALSWEAPVVDLRRNPATVHYSISVQTTGC